MRLVELLERGAPLALAKAPVEVEAPQLVCTAQGSQAHALEEGVAHQHPHAAAVCHHRLLRVGRGELGGLSHAGPLVDQRGVDAAHHHAQPGDDVVELLGALVERDSAVQHAEGVAQVAQQQALAAGDAVGRHVALEGVARLEHLAQDALGVDLVVARPGDLLAVHVEGALQQLLERFGVGNLLNLLEALVVVDAVCLHLGHGLVARAALLRAQDLARLLERGLHHAHKVERVVLVLLVEQLQGRQQEGRQGLVERKVARHVDRGDVVRVAVFVLEDLDHAGVDERGEYLLCPHAQLVLAGVVLVAGADELLHAPAGVPAALEHVEHHGVGDAHARLEGLWHGVDEVLEAGLVPVDEVLRRALELELAQLLRV